MLILLSPAKNLDFAPVPTAPPATTPRLTDDIRELAAVTATLTESRIASLMDLSPALAALNHARFQALDPVAAGEGTLQAALAFNGDVYRGLSARTLDADAQKWAQEHVRILSGLYGLLRPLDAIMPYRLEMGTRLKTARGASLYAFWGERIARLVDADLEGHGHRVVVNLASSEYASAVDRSALSAPMINIHFQERKDGVSRVMGVYAKYARGLMARHIIDHRIEDPQDLRGFALCGYSFQPGASGSTDWVFAREQPATKTAA
jgi:uncharacterized protein